MRRIGQQSPARQVVAGVEDIVVLPELVLEQKYLVFHGAPVRLPALLVLLDLEYGAYAGFQREVVPEFFLVLGLLMHDKCE